MALELMPDGTFKKLSKIQTDALDRYYKREKGDLLDTILPRLLPSLILGGVGSAGLVVAWSYLKDLELPTVESFGFNIADLTSRIYGNEPKSDKYFIYPDGSQHEVPICSRWEADATEWFGLQERAKDPISITLNATYGLSIIKNMKREGCPKPPAFTQSQWDEGKI